jgi:hypothetical protein
MTSKNSFLNFFYAGKDPFHTTLGKPTKGFLQGLPGKVLIQKRPHLHPGLPAVDEITAGKAGLDPAAVIKGHHGPHLGAIDLQQVVLVNHRALAKSRLTCYPDSRSQPTGYPGFAI